MCSAIQVRHSRSGTERAYSAYFNAVAERFAKHQCLSKACSSNADDFKTPKNLLSLVKYRVGSQGAAYAAISQFLGFAGRSFDITNGKFRTHELPQTTDVAGKRT